MAKYSGKGSRLSGMIQQAKPMKVKPSTSGRVSAGMGAGWDFIRYLFDTVLGNFRRHRIIFAGIGAGIIIAFIIILINDYQKVRDLAHFRPSVTTRIYDKNDILIAELFKQKREVVDFEKIPKHLRHAFIAMEDNEFYDHFGINLKGIVRAFFINILAGGIRQGGSTITQQTAKILLTSRKRNIYRKIKEAFIAIMMEMGYSKNDIFSLYLNQIYLGHGAYGVESAAGLYFKKHVWELNLAECAILSTLPSAPNRLSPIRHPKRSMQRHRIALAKMVEMGFLTVTEAEKAYLDFWPDYLRHVESTSPSLNVFSNRVNRAPWFTEYIRRKLVRKYGSEMVYNKGLLVYTTLDIKKQMAGQEVLEKALEKQTTVSSRLQFKNDSYFNDNFTDMVGLISDLFDINQFRKRGSRQNEKLNNYVRTELIEELEGLNYLTGISNISDFIDEYKGTYLQDRDLQKVEGCLISINQKNGYIEALIGGSEFSSINQLIRPMQSRRQPGSAIKPLLYSAAIESREFTPATAVLDSPIVYLDNEGGDWLPENYEGQYYGLLRLRKALALSINVISIRLAEKIGIERVLTYYQRLLRMSSAEAKKRIPRNFSIALGSLEVSPYELTRAYAIIANGGKDVIPFTIRYIKDQEGKVLENREKDVALLLKEKAKKGVLQVIKPSTAQVMISLLRGVVSAGTGRGAFPGRPAAGKTGTTNNWKDAWFVGFVPQLTTGIWIGYDKLGLSLGIGQAGGAVSAPVWGRYMRAALKHEPVQGFPTYAGLTEKEVCSRTGLLPSSACQKVIKEIFVPGTEPEKECETCAGITHDLNLPKKGPRDNISRRQKASVLRNIKKRRDSSVIDDLSDDLLSP